MNSQELLKDLIAFPTVSSNPNRALIDYCASLLKDTGADVTIIEDIQENKANLYATIGPTNIPGVLLSGILMLCLLKGKIGLSLPLK